VVDSWLVEDGWLRALELHAHRFRDACAAMLDVPAAATEEFFWTAIGRIPTTGAWFPRVELVVANGEPRFQLWIREAPPRHDTIRLWLPGKPDQRTRPTVKGPDLAQLADLRQAATAHGADEAVLTASDGAVVEGGTTSIVWWRGDVLCVPSAEQQVLPGVTRTVIALLAASDGIPTVGEACRPDELDGLETWAVNALHGIRPVTEWVGTEVRPGAAERAEAWRARLAAEMTHIKQQRFVRPSRNH
jgi:branched-subunit amino acid aminotransferase/4-amino-4-deoxychorismate lyase